MCAQHVDLHGITELSFLALDSFVSLHSFVPQMVRFHKLGSRYLNTLLTTASTISALTDLSRLLLKLYGYNLMKLMCR